MKIPIVPIGNSRGIRIPKAILQQCRIRRFVDLEVKNDQIVLHPIQKPRQEWKKAFEKMRENKDDQLIIDDNLDLETENWKW
ncbi:MAG: AbrB/MazE/SpoVT family DNA-binding domain-containing protein [Candidatus Omnitrophica bacterium]|nr:AbrB/MazE/SpoVT family DNA-binding domain-containing protein [Candidatus Omnitrophota bacterium]